MSKTVDVLIVVDTAGALASRDLGANVYLIDTNKHDGSGNEGQAELYTACDDGDTIVWRVVSVAPSGDVSISNFTGQMITNNVCVPRKQGFTGEYYWAGRVESQGRTEQEQYSVVLNVEGVSMTFDPFLKITG